MTSRPAIRPRMPAPQSSSPKRATRSARTPGPLSRNGTGSPEWITSGSVGVAWSPVTQRIASPRRSPQSRKAVSRRSMVSRLTRGSLVWPASSGALRWQRTNVAPSSSARRARPMRSRSAAAGSASSGAATNAIPRARARPPRNGDAPTITPSRPWRSPKAGAGRGRPHHFSVTAVSPRPPGAARTVARLHASAARAVAAASGTRATGRITGWRSRKKGSVSVTASWPPPPTRRIPSPGRAGGAERLHREVEALDAGRGPGGGERLGGPAVGHPGAAGRPEGVAAALGEAQRGEGEHVGVGDLLPVAERLHHRPPGGLLRGVAEDRPVRDLAGGGAARAERPEQAARPARREGVEAGRPGGLVGGPAAVRGRCPVAQAVKQQDDDRAHGRRGGSR